MSRRREAHYREPIVVGDESCGAWASSSRQIVPLVAGKSSQFGAEIDWWNSLAYYQDLETLMRPDSRASKSHTWQIVMRTATILLLVMIVADLADASCYPSEFSTGNLITSSSQAGTADPCGTVCVPDCFCCSNLGPALLVFSFLTTETVTEAPVPPVYYLAAGISPTLDHVPLTAL